MGKRILVAGGAGFIGSNLCRALVSADPENMVICLDNLYTGSLANIKDLMLLENFVFIEHEICLHTDLSCDVVINLACPASPVAYQKDDLYTLNTNYLGTIRLLSLARQNKAKFIQASTSEIYGDPLVHPQDESYFGNVNTVGPRSCYDEGKRVAETLCYIHAKNTGLDTTILRIFNTYGPGMQTDDGRVVSNFIMQAITGKPITIYGDGTQTRSLCYVDDLVRAFISVMEEQAGFVVMNVGNNHEVTMNQLALTIMQLCGKGFDKIDFSPLPKDDPKQRQPDTLKIYGKLGWQPKIDLTDGLKKTIAYFRGICDDNKGEELE